MRTTLGHFFAAFRTWERGLQVAFTVALVLLLTAFGALIFGPAETRTPAIIGMVGLLLAMQVIVLRGNREMVTPFTQAQRKYLDGDLNAARWILEKALEEKPDVKVLTLLGNIYRQWGRLTDSEVRLRQALEQEDDATFPLVGLGRTLLAQGRYDEATKVLRRALDKSAPPQLQLDLAEALFHQGARDDAKEILLKARSSLNEPYQALMADYLLYALQAGPPPSEELAQAGLPYWQASAERFQKTPYGQAIAQSIRAIEKMQKELRA